MFYIFMILMILGIIISIAGVIKLNNKIAKVALTVLAAIFAIVFVWSTLMVRFVFVDIDKTNETQKEKMIAENDAATSEKEIAENDNKETDSKKEFTDKDNADKDNTDKDNKKTKSKKETADKDNKKAKAKKKATDKENAGSPSGNATADTGTASTPSGNAAPNSGNTGIPSGNKKPSNGNATTPSEDDFIDDDEYENPPELIFDQDELDAALPLLSKLVGGYKVRKENPTDDPDYDGSYWYMYFITGRSPMGYFAIYDEGAGNPGVQGPILSISEDTVECLIDQDLYEHLPHDKWQDSGDTLVMHYELEDGGVCLENNDVDIHWEKVDEMD